VEAARRTGTFLRRRARGIFLHREVSDQKGIRYGGALGLRPKGQQLIAPLDLADSYGPKRMRRGGGGGAPVLPPLRNEADEFPKGRVGDREHRNALKDPKVLLTEHGPREKKPVE